MKTLRWLRNLAALFIVCGSMFMSPSPVSAVSGCKWTCIASTNNTRCKLQSTGGCVNEVCHGKCKGSACLPICIF